MIKLYWFNLLLVAIIGILCVSLFNTSTHLDTHDKTIERLDSAEKKLTDLLWRARLERDSLTGVIDSVALSRKVIIEKIKAIPVIVPTNYDGLSNKQLEKEMIETYKRSKK